MKSVLKWIILIILITALCGGIVWLVMSFSEKESPELPEDVAFSVSYNGTEYGSQGGSYYVVLPASGQALFEERGTESYTVQVGSNLSFVTETGVLTNYYTFDGKFGLFEADDYTEQFIKEGNFYDDHFVIDCTPGCYDLQTLLSDIWSADVTFHEPILEEYVYKMTVTSSVGEEIILLLKQE